ncbi:HSP20 family protein [Marinococcus luteus]|uniref:HSP20 family protein n=2 Tax=Marinococcus luteus TaxID=1122204 RepID=A0A1H2QS59_9BACI|nr:HSP20 family protein [Marinococcus luteus]
MMADLTPNRRNRGFFPDLSRGFGFGDLLNDHFLEPLQDMNKFKLDVREEDKEYVVEAELPGFHKEDIQVEYGAPVLSISAKREEKQDIDHDDYVHRERSYGEFRRRITLENIKEDEIQASFKNGVLKLQLPKEDKRSVTKKQIDIQ